MAYAFRASESQDFTIIDLNDENKIIGHVRVKPSGILWADKSGQTWYRLSIKKFAELAKKHGTEQGM